MIKTTLEIFGMKCSMCESHINSAIREKFDVRKVKSSRKENKTTIFSETPLDPADLRTTVSSLGYTTGKEEQTAVDKTPFFYRQRHFNKRIQ